MKVTVTNKNLLQRLPQYLQEVEGRDVSGLFRCVLPAHNDSTASMSLCDSGIRVKCFSCTNDVNPHYSTFSLFDIIRLKADITNFDDIRFIAAHFTMGAKLPSHLVDVVSAMDIEPEQQASVSTTPKLKRTKRKVDTPEKLEKRKRYILECQQRLQLPAYIEVRGISLRTLEKLGAGYDPAFQIFDHQSGYTCKHPAIIFPMSNGSYCARLLADVASEYKTRCRGPKGVINKQALRSERPIFIVEGPMDVASLIEVGAEAVSTAAVNAHKYLIEAIQNTNPHGTYVISFDYDESEGVREIVEQNAQKLAEQLRAIGATVYIEQVSSSYNDANDFLRADRAGLEIRVKEMIAKYQQNNHKGVTQTNG